MGLWLHNSPQMAENDSWCHRFCINLAISAVFKLCWGCYAWVCLTFSKRKHIAFHDLSSSDSVGILGDMGTQSLKKSYFSFSMDIIPCHGQDMAYFTIVDGHLPWTGVFSIPNPCPNDIDDIGITVHASSIPFSRMWMDHGTCYDHFLANIWAPGSCRVSSDSFDCHGTSLVQTRPGRAGRTCLPAVPWISAERMGERRQKWKYHARCVCISREGWH